MITVHYKDYVDMYNHSLDSSIRGEREIRTKLCNGAILWPIAMYSMTGQTLL